MDQDQKKPVTVKDAALFKYNDDGFEVNNFHHISFSPKRKASLSKALDLTRRSILALDDCDVTCIGNPEDILELCPNLEELDLTSNHISDWREVCSMISQMHQLRVINLSSNPLNATESEMDFSAFKDSKSLKKLILNNTGVPLTFVYSLLELLTGVEELFLSLNEYTSIPDTDKKFPHIKQLYLNEHCITDWKQLMHLGKIFPQLEQLTMTDCPLETIFPDNAEKLFPMLKVLRLNNNAISEWSSVDALNAFPKLQEVKLVGIPLIEDDNEETRQLLLARLPNLTKINGARVNDKEREDAERFFIRYHMDDDCPPQRYHELVKVYGVLERLAEVNLAPPSSVKISIIYEERPALVRDVCLKQTTRDFKKYLSNELGVPCAKMKVFHHDVGFVHDEMKFLDRDLYRYHMKDGDEILVYNKDN